MIITLLMMYTVLVLSSMCARTCAHAPRPCPLYDAWGCCSGGIIGTRVSAAPHRVASRYYAGTARILSFAAR
jgi:hypothetical protein